jgi:large subunit ribosomal protein L22
MKRIRPAPMGRAYRYQRRLTHIVLSVAERGTANGLVAKVEETAPAHATTVKKSAGKTAGKTKTAKATKPAAKKAAATKKKSGK